jgi:hypothetical protein
MRDSCQLLLQCGKEYAIFLPVCEATSSIMVNLQVNKFMFSDDLKPGDSGTVWQAAKDKIA